MWNPQRVEVIGSVLERYSPHIAEGHRLRVGMEGDPCTPYKGANEAPIGTIMNLTRSDDGSVKFSLQIDGTEDVLELDNQSVHPERIWEIDPAYLQQFRGAIDHDEDPPVSNTIDEKYRGQIENRFSLLTDQVGHIEELNSDFRASTTSTLRYLASDLLKLAKGEHIEFAQHYADRYDMAVEERSEEGYQGVSKESKVPCQHQYVKWKFNPSEVSSSSSLAEGGSVPYGAFQGL